MITQTDFAARARGGGVVPVLTVEDVGQAVPLARALCAGGLNIIEITLRTDAALPAIEAIATSDVDCVVGAGTILSESDIHDACKAGAEFLVTPGTPAALVPALSAYNGPVLPGASTATEAMNLYGAGFSLLKFFPAEPSGGAAFLKALAGPLPGLLFMPTGGIKQANMNSYLELPNVVAVGGTWLTPTADVEAGCWTAIEARAREAFNNVPANTAILRALPD